MQTTPGDRGGKSKTVVQKAPGTDSGSVALDLPLAKEINQAEFFWAPEMARVRQSCGQKRVFAADLRNLVKGKLAEVALEGGIWI